MKGNFFHSKIDINVLFKVCKHPLELVVGSVKRKRPIAEAHFSQVPQRPAALLKYYVLSIIKTSHVLLGWLPLLQTQLLHQVAYVLVSRVDNAAPGLVLAASDCHCGQAAAQLQIIKLRIRKIYPRLAD